MEKRNIVNTVKMESIEKRNNSKYSKNGIDGKKK